MKGRLSWSTRTTSLLILKPKPRLLCRNFRDYGAKPIIVKKQRDEIGIGLYTWGPGSSDCAGGFGVCCVFMVSTCATTVSQNCSYIKNPNYPSAYTDTTACSFTIAKCSSGKSELSLRKVKVQMSITTKCYL